MLGMTKNRLSNRDPFIASAGIGHGLDYFHVTQAIFKGRIWPIATTCFDGIQEVIFHVPIAGEFFRNFHFLQRAIPRLPPRALDAILHALGRELLTRRAFAWYLALAHPDFASIR